MKVDYISDLHIDFWIKELNPGTKLDAQIKQFCKTLEIFGGEVLIVAGDLGHYYVQDSAFLRYVKSIYTDVLIVPGNHDMYLVSNGTKAKYKFNSFNRINEMKVLCEEIGVHYLDGQTVNITGTTFAGVGMSWDKSFIENLKKCDCTDAEIIKLYNQTMNDAKLIYSGKDHTRIQGPYGSELFYGSFEPFKFFHDEMAKLKAIGEVDVMISHYGPCTPPDMNPEYKFNTVSTFFYFNGADEIQRIKPKFWVYGHTHTRADYTFGVTNMLCAPLGYPGENTYATVQSFEI